MERENEEQIADKIANMVNCFGIEPKLIAENMARQHRTLQQSFTALCFAWIKKCAAMKEEGRYDGRNEYSVTECAKIAAAFELHNPPFI